MLATFTAGRLWATSPLHSSTESAATSVFTCSERLLQLGRVELIRQEGSQVAVRARRVQRLPASVTVSYG